MYGIYSNAQLGIGSPPGPGALDAGHSADHGTLDRNGLGPLAFGAVDVSAGEELNCFDLAVLVK